MSCTNNSRTRKNVTVITLKNDVVASTTESSKGQFGMVRSKDLPWSAKKIAVLTALRDLGATSPTKSVGSSEVAEKANVTPRDVRHYCYHAMAGGWVGSAKVEGQVGYGFHLTQKGAKADFAKEQAKEQAGKAGAQTPATETTAKPAKGKGKGKPVVEAPAKSAAEIKAEAKADAMIAEANAKAKAKREAKGKGKGKAKKETETVVQEATAEVVTPATNDYDLTTPEVVQS